MNRPLYLFALAWILALTSPAIAEPPSAADLLDASIAYHDPDGRFLTQAHRLLLTETRPEASDRKTELVIDVAGERFEMARRTEVEVAGTMGDGRCEMTLDGRSEVTEAEREEHRLSCERLELMRNYYTYLWGLPMKLRDAGTVLGEVSATTFDGRDVYGLKVTYDAAVGGDTWYFYFDRASSALTGYRFYHDEAKNDGEYILLEGELEAEGLRLPKSRAWYTHQGDRHLGTDILTAIKSVDG